MPRGRHRRVGDVPSLMDLPSDSDVTPRRDAEVLSSSDDDDDDDDVDDDDEDEVDDNEGCGVLICCGTQL